MRVFGIFKDLRRAGKGPALVSGCTGAAPQPPIMCPLEIQFSQWLSSNHKALVALIGCSILHGAYLQSENYPF